MECLVPGARSTLEIGPCGGAVGRWARYRGVGGASDRAGSDGAGSDGAGSDGAGSDGTGSDGAGSDGAGWPLMEVSSRRCLTLGAGLVLASCEEAAANGHRWIWSCPNNSTAGSDADAASAEGPAGVGMAADPAERNSLRPPVLGLCSLR